MVWMTRLWPSLLIWLELCSRPPSCGEMYREWPFFPTLLSNMDMVLAKSNIAIASRGARRGHRATRNYLSAAACRMAVHN
jgi:phosphoenolpyruvate carboxylase